MKYSYLMNKHITQLISLVCEACHDVLWTAWFCIENTYSIASVIFYCIIVFNFIVFSCLFFRLYTHFKDGE